MSRNNRLFIRRRVVSSLGTILGVTLCSIAGNAQRLDKHPVLAKYPSAEDLQRKVDEFKRENPAEFAAALDDLAEAVRFNLGLERPLKGPQPIVFREWVLYLPPLRPFYEQISDDERIKDKDISPNWVAFLREHIDKLTVEYRPATRMVALDVLLNGWNDWSDWESDRLRGYRERYPDIDRLAAMRLLMEYDAYYHQEQHKGGAPDHAEEPINLTGLCLRLLYDAEISSELRREVTYPLKDIQHREEVLDFLIRGDLAISDPLARPGSGVMQSVSRRMNVEARLDFWLPYLSHPDPSLRMLAVIEVGSTRRRPRDMAPEQHRDWETIQRLRLLAEGDPDQVVRSKANSAIQRLLDDRPPRGHVKYDKKEE